MGSLIVHYSNGVMKIVSNSMQLFHVICKLSLSTLCKSHFDMMNVIFLNPNVLHSLIKK